jgi:hypothetical protein
MAFTNGDAVHTEVELAAPFTLGTDHVYKFQEAAFFGNVFPDSPSAFYCVGRDYYTKTNTDLSFYETRACEGYNEDESGVCPYVRTGLCEDIPILQTGDSVWLQNECKFSGDAAVSCREQDIAPDPLVWVKGDKAWSNPITTFRNVQQ